MKAVRISKKQAGVTLVELIVALALVGVVLAAAGTMLLQAYANEAAYREQNAAQQNSRTALDTVADDLRGAKRTATVVTVGTTKAMLPTNTVMNTAANNVTPSNITNYTTPLYFDIYDDSGNLKRVRYWLYNNELHRELNTNFSSANATAAAGGTIVARNITFFTAQKPGYDPSSPLSSNYNVVQIVITSTSGTSTVTLRGDVTLRNNLL